MTHLPMLKPYKGKSCSIAPGLTINENAFSHAFSHNCKTQTLVGWL